MKVKRYFVGGSDRYGFDFSLCSSRNGFAQIDTEQDAWYYGTWANAKTLQIISYAEGDVTVKTADSPKEFAEEIRELKTWTEKFGYEFQGIDPMLNKEIEQQFMNVGLGDLLH